MMPDNTAFLATVQADDFADAANSKTTRTPEITMKWMTKFGSFARL
jgi:hypothetical protein